MPSIPAGLLKFRTPLLLAGGLVSLLVIVLIWQDRTRRAMTAPQVAMTMMRAIENRDSRALLAMSDPLEKELLRLDEPKLAKLLAWYQECTKGCSLGEPEATPDTGSMQFHTRPMTCGDHVIGLDLPTILTPDGQMGNVVMPLVTAGILAKYSPPEGRLDQVSRWRALSKGLAAERARLTEMGIAGYVFTQEEPAKLTDWDQFIRESTGMADRLEQRRATAGARALSSAG